MMTQSPWRNPLLLIAGDVALVMAFWLVFLNVSWLCYQTTHSSLMLSLSGILINVFFLTCPFFGWVADRLNKQRIVLTGLVLFLLPTGLLIVLYWLKSFNIASLLMIGALLGLIFAGLRPAENALAKETVTTASQLQRVVSATNASIKASKLFAATLNGALLLLGGVALAFGVIPILTIIALCCFGLLRIPKAKPVAATVDSTQPTAAAPTLWESTTFAFKSSQCRKLVLLSALSEMVMLAVLFQLPVFSGQYTNGLHVLTLFYLFSGLGGLLGGGVVSLFLANSTNRPRIAIIALALMALGLLGFALSKTVWAHCFWLLWFDGCWIVVNSLCSTTLQLTVDPKYRGTILGVLLMGNIGFSPLMILGLGVLMSTLGILWALITLVVGMLILAVFYYFVWIPGDFTG